VRLFVLVLVAAALTVGPAQAKHAACDRAKARAAIASTHLRMTLLGDSPTRVDPGSADQILCHDFTRDGRLDLAVTIASGGTAGDIGFVVFRANPGRMARGAGDGRLQARPLPLGTTLPARSRCTGRTTRTVVPRAASTTGVTTGTAPVVVARNWHTRSFRP